jgi:glyoxylase-like metal-dependent hydrolase (beta-lactamase superfamily II)
MSWQPVHPHVFLWRDSCNVYAVIGPAGAIVVNAGAGAWLEALDQLPAQPAALLCTHFFRDHSAGAARAAELGIPVFVPEGERAIFADPAQHFRQRDTYIIYDNYWDLFAPITPTKVAGVLRDYEILHLAGLEVQVLPLPGVTVNQAGVTVRLNGEKLVFCGEAIHSPGKVARVAPYQYNYNDLGGAVNAFWSARDLRKAQPDGLFPSLGAPMLGRAFCDSALEALEASLIALCDGRPWERSAISNIDKPALSRVTEHVWRTTQTASINYFLVSNSGKVLAIDYGYHEARGVLAGEYAKPYRRRALLHSLEALKAETGIDRIDVALISHFHDDHVCGVPLLQRVQGTRCWATDAFADLLANPDAHCFPCNWPQALRIDKRIREDETVQWEEFTFHFGRMNGHTRFSSLIGFEADGKRFAHTGDQYFFLDKADNWLQGAGELREWADKRAMQNHVYRNGALLNGFALSAAWMRQWQPEIVLSGHQSPFYTNADFFDLLDRWTQEYEAIHTRIMPLGAADVHFDVDSWGGWIWPYRTRLSAPGTASVTVTVRNPLPRDAELQLRLVGPAGWQGTAALVRAAARADVSCELQITPTEACQLQPYAVTLVADGQPFGQVAEALMTVG